MKEKGFKYTHLMVALILFVCVILIGASAYSLSDYLTGLWGEDIKDKVFICIAAALSVFDIFSINKSLKAIDREEPFGYSSAALSILCAHVIALMVFVDGMIIEGWF